MRFIHYSEKEFELEPRDYDQSTMKWNAKPAGFWFSVEGPYDWKWWCESEDFRVECLQISYEVKLKETSKIVFLNSESDIYSFTQKYRLQEKVRPWGSYPDTSQLNWKQIKEKYQGIIIPKYFWECRMSMSSCWYYGWDCSSGCIWDLSCIEEFKLMEINEKVEMLR